MLKLVTKFRKIFVVKKNRITLEWDQIYRICLIELRKMFSLGIAFILIIGSVQCQYLNNPPYPARPAYGWNVANLTNPGYPTYQQPQIHRTQQYHPPPARVNATNATNVNSAVSFTAGTKGYGDQLLLQTNVYKRPTVFRSTLSKTVELRRNRTGFPKNITYIEVINHARDGSVPNVKITSGGIGKNNIELTLKSYDRPINATVLFYGKPR